MLYERKIKYLDYLEKGQRIQGGGYVKMEAREGKLRVELAVTGLRAIDSCEYAQCGIPEYSDVQTAAWKSRIHSDYSQRIY